MRKQLQSLALVLMAVFGLTTETDAQWVKRSVFDAYEFVVCGNNIFATAPTKAIYLSTDDAATWSSVGNDTLGWARALAAADTDSPYPKLFAATDGAGVWFTSDNGTTWHRVQHGLTALWMTAIGVNGSNIYAGTDQDLSGDGAWSLGAFLSSDDGANWTVIDSGLADSAAASRRIRGFHFYGKEVLMQTDTGIVISSDTGKHWLPSGFPFRWISGFAVFDTNIFVTTDENGGIFRSGDNGKHWTQLDTGFLGKTPGYYSQTLASYGNNLFVATDSGVFLSEDKGKSWREVNEGLLDTSVYALFVKGQYLFAYAVSTESAVWRRPLSDFGISAVAPATATENSLTSYPNPFSQSTTITFSSPESGAAEITIINLLGTEVAQIFEGEIGAGQHEFSWDASGMPPGMYECIVRFNGQVRRTPMMLIRN
jgi:hypothetical protein